MGGYTSVGLRSEGAATPATLYYITEMEHKATVLLERFAKQEKYLSENGKWTIRAREYPDAQ